MSETEAIISVKNYLEAGVDVFSNLQKTSNVRRVMFQQVIKTLQKRIWFLLGLPYNYVGLKTYNLECESHKVDCRRSIKRIEPFKLLYDKVLQ